MGFVTPITLRHPDFVSMQVLNTLFGAGMTNKLFMHIREELSLCYDIGSGYHGSKGILTVSAGIDCGHSQLVQDKILEQLEACRQGKISPEELASAKEALISQLRATHDSPAAIEGYYATTALSGLELTPQTYIQAVQAVTLEQVMAAAQSLRKHTVYFLKGVD
jgi:predicted Zn-dependent peptidase